MEGRRDSASAAEMTFRDEGMQPGRHPRMTLIKGRFYQSLLAGAGSRDLKKDHLLVSLDAGFCALLSAWPRCRLLTPRVHVDEARAWERGCVHKIVVVISSWCVSHHPTQRFRCVSRTETTGAVLTTVCNHDCNRTFCIIWFILFDFILFIWCISASLFAWLEGCFSADLAAVF